MNSTALQRYQMRRSGVKPEPFGPGDVEIIADDIYSPAAPAETPTNPVTDEPRGLVDRIYRQRMDAQPVRGPFSNSVPTTKNRFQ